jgi:hypothetical protein
MTETVANMFNIRTVSMIAVAMILGGCSDAGRVFGFERSGPDEFTVVRNQPLSMPPDATVRPPEDGSSNSTRDVSTNRARESLLTSAPEGEGGALDLPGPPQYSVSPGASPGEAALTERVAAYYGVDPDIRRVVDQESHRLVLEQDTLVNKLLFWQDPPPPGMPLDPAAESRRLRENEALGKPLNSGPAPVIVRKKSGMSSLY